MCARVCVRVLTHCWLALRSQQVLPFMLVSTAVNEPKRLAILQTVATSLYRVMESLYSLATVTKEACRTTERLLERFYQDLQAMRPEPEEVNGMGRNTLVAKVLTALCGVCRDQNHH